MSLSDGCVLSCLDIYSRKKYIEEMSEDRISVDMMSLNLMGLRFKQDVCRDNISG